jgi:hypothetical protein
MRQKQFRKEVGSWLRKPQALAVAGGVLLAPLLLSPSPIRASDHADTAENYNRLGADLTDVFIFPSEENANNVVLVMNVHGLIPSGQGASFDPNVLYQFKIDTSGDNIEDLVVQAKFAGKGLQQKILITHPTAPPRTGIETSFKQRAAFEPGRTNQNLTFRLPSGGNMRVFAGVREDPFFFDLERFYQILPDRMTPLTGKAINYPNPNTPQVNGFRSAGQARDYLANLNVLSIVVEMPRAALGGGAIRLWATTSLSRDSSSDSYRQQDRLARPAINEALATVSNRRHEINNKINPVTDSSALKSDIQSFLTFPAGRSRQIKDVIVAVLVPDVMIADLSQRGPAAYLGVETGGATGGTFGGRKLTDDVIDIDLGVVFGNTISALGLAPDDGQAKPQFATDNVGPEAKHFKSVFPYLGSPR